MRFHGSNDLTNSVKALKEDRFYVLGFNPIRSNPGQQYAKQVFFHVISDSHRGMLYS